MANNNKAMDVSKPGKVAADASSKPIIVSHRPMVQDPMVKPESDVSELEPQKDSPKDVNSTPTSGEKVIQPLDKDLTTDLNDIDKAAAAPSDSVAEEVNETDQKSTAPKSEADKPEPPKQTEIVAKEEPKKPAASSDAAEVDAMVDQAASGKQKEKQQAAQEAAKLEHIQKLVDEKKYFVKTGQVARRRNNRIALILLIIIVLLIGLYIAVDVRVLKPGFDVPIHVIHT